MGLIVCLEIIKTDKTVQFRKTRFEMWCDLFFYFLEDVEMFAKHC